MASDAAATAAAAEYAWGPKVYVHPEAEVSGKVELGVGCCVCAAAAIDGGPGGIAIGPYTIIKERAIIKNT